MPLTFILADIAKQKNIQDIEYFQYGKMTDTNGIPNWAMVALQNGDLFYFGECPLRLAIKGKGYVNPGDYIIKDSEGKIFSLSEKEFKEKYT